MSNNLKATLHKNAIFQKKSMCSSIQEELIFFYKAIFNINIEFTYTQSNNVCSKMNLPQLYYKNYCFSNNDIYYFLKLMYSKKYVNNKENTIAIIKDINCLLDDKEVELEKDILVDIQYSLIYYTLSLENKSYFKKLAGFISHNFLSIYNYIQEEKLKKDISSLFCLNSLEESLISIQRINTKLEIFLNEFFEKYDKCLSSLKEKFNKDVNYYNIINIDIIRCNPILLLINSLYVAQKKIILPEVSYYLLNNTLY